MPSQGLSCSFSAVLLLLLVASCSASDDLFTAQGQQLKPEKLYEPLRKGRDILLKDCEIAGPLNLQKAFPSQELTLNQGIRLTQNLYFKNCRFKGPVNSTFTQSQGRENETYGTSFQGVLSFEGCTFDGQVDLRESLFGSKTVFTDCDFRQKVNLRGCRSMGRSMAITECLFSEDLVAGRFQATGRFIFFQNNIRGLLSFQSSSFLHQAQFSNLTNGKFADFSRCQFYGPALFAYAELQGAASFNNSSFLNKADWNHAEAIKKLSISNCQFFGPVSFAQAAIRYELDLSESHFQGSAPDFAKLQLDDAAKLSLEKAALLRKTPLTEDFIRSQ